MLKWFEHRLRSLSTMTSMSRCFNTTPLPPKPFEDLYQRALIDINHLVEKYLQYNSCTCTVVNKALHVLIVPLYMAFFTLLISDHVSLHLR